MRAGRKGRGRASRVPLAGAGCAVLVVLQLLPGPGAAQVAEQSSAVTAAIQAARGGGTVILCRHGATGSFGEREPVDYGDPSSQRRLSAEGRRQSRALGRALGALGIELAEVVASPMQRALRTAELMTGGASSVRIDSVWHTNDGDYGGPPRNRRARILATPVPRGNRLIVSHIGTMRSVLPDDVGRIGEGDCVVARPTPVEGGERGGEGDAASVGTPAGPGRGYVVLGVVPRGAWERAAGRLRPVPPTSGGDTS